MGKRPKNTSKTKCDWQTLTAPPHRRGKLKYRSPFTLRRYFAAAHIPRIGARSRDAVNEKPPMRERGRGTAKRWWGRNETVAYSVLCRGVCAEASTRSVRCRCQYRRNELHRSGFLLREFLLFRAAAAFFVSCDTGSRLKCECELW